MSTANSADYIGTYKILNKIGEGGMALIYKALQPSLKRTVVLKKLKDPNREIINRFKKEALLSASFHHENLVAIYDFIYTKRSYYLAMEYVDGEDLRTIIDYMAPLPAALAGLIILDIVRGLEYTHARNIIHRDIKPGNILVSYSGDVKLIDFGVAKDDVSTRLTLTGMIVGTPAYMAPEQANGEPLSAGSDLFSTGILLYELLTGIKPFFGDNNTEILAKIVRNKYIPAERINPEIPRAFRKIIKKAIHKDQKHRYQNATEMINDLENAISWQTRSTKKTVIGRFLKDLDKTRETASTDSIKMQIFSAMPTWGWTVLRSALGILIAFLLVFQGIRFNQSQLGYLQLQGQDDNYAVKINDSQTKQITNQSTVLGPFLKGDYKLRAFKAQTPGVFVSDINISAQDTFRLDIPKVTVTDSVQLSISSEPADSYVYINDKLAGRTPVDSLRLASGKHRISFSKTGYLQRDESIELESGQFYAFRFKLTRQR